MGYRLLRIGAGSGVCDFGYLIVPDPDPEGGCTEEAFYNTEIEES
jgi:hypothetical protein